jgi:hypothetical protein
MFLHVINKSLILFDKQSKKTSNLDGITTEVNTSTMLEYVDDNVEVPSSSSVVVGSRSHEVNSLHLYLT